MACSYTIFLIKPQFTEIRSVIGPEEEVDSFQLNALAGLTGTLYVSKQRDSVPAWVKLLRGYVEGHIQGHSAGISAVLVVRYESRLFAITFGHGRHMLTPSCWVRDFGLKVTLNRVDRTKLRSFDCRTYDETVLATRRQTSKDSEVSAFQIDIMRDLVRGIAGEPTNDPHYLRLYGADALRAVTNLEFKDLGDILSDSLAAYSERGYQQHFPWIDNIREVDSQIAQELDAKLVESLQAGHHENMLLAPPEVLDALEEPSFRYPSQPVRRLCHEIDLNDYLEFQGGFSAITLHQLQQQKVKVLFDGSATPRYSWTIYDCVVWETVYQNDTYVLHDGRWFKVDSGYSQKVRSRINELTEDIVSLPNAVIGEIEKEYNARVAETNISTYALLDSVPFKPTGAATQIEFCDLFTHSGHLIHVKRSTRSSTLSHLFSQGSVAGELLLQDQGLREQLQQYLNSHNYSAHAEFITTLRPNASAYSVVYAVITKTSSHSNALPFFSQVTLFHHSNRLTNLGYKVFLQYIPTV